MLQISVDPSVSGVQDSQRSRGLQTNAWVLDSIVCEEACRERVVPLVEPELSMSAGLFTLAERMGLVSKSDDCIQSLVRVSESYRS